MPSVAATAMPEGYARWQVKLAAEFFEGHEGQPVVMFVGRDELDTLADDGEDCVRSLAAAVRGVVDVSQHGTMFEPVTRLERAWQHGSRATPPPTLPVLALSVLAASEMRSDPSGARHNYYIRLARALLPDGTDAEVDILRTDLRERGAFVDVATMWQRLDAWLEEQAGTFGTSTIREDREYTRIGYPLSQTLLRRSDHAALTRFFVRMRLKQAGTPAPSTLLSLLKVWTYNRNQGFSDRFVEALDDATLQDYLEPLVHGLAVAWDGNVITASGLRRLEIRPAIDLDEGEAWWVVPAVAGAPDDVLVGTSDSEEFTVIVTTDPHSSMLDAIGLPEVTPHALTVGLSARGEESYAEFEPSKLLVFMENAHAGGWLAVDAVQPYEEHVFAVTRHLSPGVEEALRSAADSGWRKMKDTNAERLLSGYSIYYRVNFSDQRLLEAATRVLPGTTAAPLRIGTTARPRLINGLPMFRNLSRNTYLAGGEPDLELPVGAEPRTVEVTLDYNRSQPFRASIFPIPFARFGPYESGIHTIEADGEELAFIVSPGPDAGWQAPGVGSLFWIGGNLREIGEPAEVCGALTNDLVTDDDVLARRGALENWIVDRSGHVRLLEEPALPTFLPGASFMCFEVARDEGAWLLQRRAKGWQATRLRVAEPAFRELTTQDRQVWASASATVRLDDPIWKLYLEAWERRSAS
ncbi:hypothetical protein [Myceligenerans xiligouense]|nr:hypothetical protein [Myceligenerans xiligouense]